MFEKIKKQIVENCKESGACWTKFTKLIKAETDADFFDVVFNNISWVLENEIFRNCDFSELPAGTLLPSGLTTLELGSELPAGTLLPENCKIIK